MDFIKYLKNGDAYLGPAYKMGGIYTRMVGKYWCCPETVIGRLETLPKFTPSQGRTLVGTNWRITEIFFNGRIYYHSVYDEDGEYEELISDPYHEKINVALGELLPLLFKEWEKESVSPIDWKPFPLVQTLQGRTVDDMLQATTRCSELIIRSTFV